MANYDVVVPIEDVEPDRTGTYVESLTETVLGKPIYQLSGWIMRAAFDGVNDYWVISNVLADDLDGARNLIISDDPTPPIGTWPGYYDGGNLDAEVTLGAEETEPPDAPPKPTVLYHHREDATDHRLRCTVPSVLSDGATGYKLRVRDVLGNNPTTSSVGDPEDVLESITLQPKGYRGYASWVAVNSAGETEGPPVGFSFHTNGRTDSLVQFSGLLHSEPPVLPVPALDDSGGTWEFQTDTWADDLTVVGLVKDLTLSPDPYGDIQQYIIQDTGSGESTLSHPVSEFDTVRLAFMAPNFYGTVIGEWRELPSADYPEKPPIPIVDASSEDVEIEALSFDESWDTVKLEYQRVGYPTIDSENVVEDTLLIIGPLLLNQPYRARYVAYNAEGFTLGDWIPFTPTGSGTGNPSGPDKPDEIRITHNSGTYVRLELPALPANADGLRLYKNGVLHSTGHAGGNEVVVTGLVAETDYEFYVQAYNLYGTKNGDVLLLETEVDDSGTDPGDPPPFTSVGTWVTPGSGATLKNTVVVSFKVVDSGGPTSGHKIYTNGRLHSDSMKLVSGNMQSGVFKTTWNTRGTYQGTVVLTAEWLDSEDELHTITRTVTLENTRATGILYRDFYTGLVAPTGKEYSNVKPTLFLGSLSPNLSERYWGDAAVKGIDDLPVVTEVTTEEEAAEDFNSMQPITMVDSREFSGGKVVSTVSGVTLASPGVKPFVRVRATPYLTTSFFLTGSERVAKIREIQPGLHMVFSQNPDRLFTYDGTSLTQKIDFGVTLGLTNVTDVAMFADKIYIIDTGRLLAYDINPDVEPRQRTLQLVPFGEDREPKFLEVVGGKLVCVFEDAGLPDNKVVAMTVSADQFDNLWEMDGTVDFTWTREGILYLISGDELYFANGSLTQLVGPSSFSANISAVADGLVALADGSIWSDEGTDWAAVSDNVPETPVNAITKWFGSFNELSAVYSTDDDILYMQNKNGSWNDQTQIVPPVDDPETITSIEVLDRFFVETEVQSEENVTVTEIDERILGGTGDDGIFFDFSLARKSSPSSFLFTEIEDCVGVGVYRTKKESS